MTVSRMTKDDINSVCLIEKECFSAPWTEENLLSELDNPTALFYVAKNDGRVIGYVGANNILGEVFMTNIAVTKISRGKGVASALLDELISSCKKLDCVYLTLEVRESNISAIKLYEKFGFRCVGTRKNFYSSPTENALLYTLDF